MDYLADAVGLIASLSVAVAPTTQRRRGHDPDEVRTDLIVAIAGGAKTLSDLATPRDQLVLFGPVAWHPPCGAPLAAAEEAALERIKTESARTRRPGHTGFLNECRQRHVRFVIGHQLTVDIRIRAR